MFWKFANDATETAKGETLTSSRLLLTRGYSVFNAAQVDGYTPMPETARPMPERVAYADMFFKAIGADVSHSGDRAYYAHATDPIQMPPFAAFTENVAYYSTWHTNRRIGPRTPRAVIGSWGNDSAIWCMGLRSSSQIGAAFTCAHLGLSTEPREDHAQYINSWLTVLKADSKAIFTAASKVQQATDWMIARANQSSTIAEVAA